MKGRFWRKALAAALALLIVSGSTPIQPFSQVFDRTVIKASAVTQTVTKTVKFDMDGGQSGTTNKLDNYNIYSSSAGTLHWSCNQPNVNYILYSYTPENGRPGRTMLRGNLLQYEGTAEFCDIVGKVTKVEISNFRFDSSGVEMRVGQDRTNTSTLLHLEGTTNDFDYSSTDDADYGSVVFEGEVDVDKNNPLKIMLYPKEISTDTTAEFDFRGGSITITYEVEEEVTGDPGHTFSFNATGNTLTATCNQTDADHACGLTNGTATLTLTANDMAFDGSLLRRTATLNTQDFSKATGITDIVTTFIYEDKNTHETSNTGVIFVGDYTVTATIIINGDTEHPYTLTKDFSVVDGHKINNVYSQFSLSKSAALKGEEVTITYSKKTDESLEGLTLTGATSGNTIPYITNTDGTYTFTMPDEDVNLNATITYPINENDITQNGDTFTIKTADGWDYFCQRMKVDGELNGFSGKTVELGDDITVNTMAGSTNYPFKGTFDGKGHTLTFNTTALMANTAPFHITDGATIRNLHVTGLIEGGIYNNMGGLVGMARGNLTIENCWVSTQISTTYNSNYDVGIGGIVGYIDYTNYLDECQITGCVYDGLIYNPNSAGRTYGCGGFVGAMAQYVYVELTDCLFIEGQYDNNNGKCELWWGNENDKNSTFFHRSNNQGEGTLKNCFFVATHFLKQGSPAVTSATKPANLGAETDHCFMKSYGHVLFFDGKYYTPKYGDLIEQYGYSGEKSYTIECNDGTSLGIPDFTSQLSTTYLRYNRKFTAGKAEVVMLPFNFTKNDFRRGDFDNNLNGKFYSFAGTDGSVTVMDDANEVTSMIANTPYIYVPGENSEYWYIARYGSDITIFTEGNDGGNKTVTDEYGLWTLTGTYEQKSFTTDDSNIMMLNDVGKQLVPVTDAPTDATKVSPTSGYFVRDSSVFAITVNSGEGGTITADPLYAKEKDKVTLTVTPDEGYVLKSLTVKDSSNTPITVTNNQFTMPDSNVTVTAVFEALSASSVTITKQPTNLDLEKGVSSGNTLTVEAEAITGHTLSYQWYKNTTNSKEGGSAISGATEASYAVPTDSEGTIYYYCVVTATRTDNGETSSETSAIAAVTVADYSTVIWKNGNDTLETDDHVRNGTTPSYDGVTPTKAATAQYTYTFSGWSDGTNTYAPNALPTVSDDVTYTAQFDRTINKYTVTWLDGDGKTLKTEQVAYGETPAYTGDTPTKTATAQYSYTFKGWGTITAVTANATYTAQFDSEVNKYTVTWKNGDTVLETDSDVPYGATPTYNGEAPTKAATAQYSYSFAGWSPEISDVTGNVTYTAQFSSTAKSYTITYKVDGEVYDTKTVSYGDSIALIDAPTREGYTFSGWQTSYTTMPASDIEITGSFKADIAYSNVYFNLTHNTYTGSEISPVFTVSYGDTVLTENTDFVVESGNTGTAAGTYTLTLTGTGAYTGTLTAEWYIDPVKNYHVTVTNGTIMGDSDYEEQAVVTVVGNTEVGGWYNGDTLVSAEQTYSFYAVSDVDLEWRADDAYAAEKAEEGIANITISPRIINSNGKTTVTVTSTWTLPEGAEIIQAGTYRCYVDKGADTPDSNYMIANGTFNASTLTECKGTFYFNINMGVVSAARKLCTMTYVTYTLNGETYTITSDVAYSEAE